MGRETGVLVVVATPIGNLDDLSPRAAEALRKADVVACEDTRRTAGLLRHAGSEVPMVPTHEHNETGRSVDLVERVRRGQTVALVSDAGLPGLSDPGRTIVAAMHAEGLPVSVLPGPSAAAAALVVSGFPVEPHRFVGFPPAKGAARGRAIEDLLSSALTTVVFENPRRLPDLLGRIAEREPARQLLVGRELTKLHEELARGPAAELAERFAGPPKGEVTVVVSPAEAADDGDGVDDAVEALLDVGLSPSSAADAVAALGIGRRNAAYRAALAADARRSER
ncbi:MAG: 16S rRNA (cytidine(1402)-2'-O)-methyltransferase [Miltoncostaeaceae bacterium]